MKKRIAALRCPDDLLAAIDEICLANHLSRSAFLSSSLRHYLMVLAENGLISPVELKPLSTEEINQKIYSRTRDYAAYVHYPSDEEEDDDLGLLAAEFDFNE